MPATLTVRRADEAAALPKLKYSLTDIEAVTGECRSVLYDAISAGHLRTFLVGRRRFALPADVEAWVHYLAAQSDAGNPVAYRREITQRSRAAKAAA